jgi:hypothetical protein
VSGYGTVLFPTEFSSGSISIFFGNHFLSATNAYTLGISAIVMAVAVATLSIIFVGLAYENVWSGGPACSMAESLCRRPSLMAIPVLATIAWGLMLMTDK